MRGRGATLLLLVTALFGPLAAAENGPSAWDILRQIVLVPGVSGHEGPVADFIQKSLPPRVKAGRDAMHNVWFTVGSGKPHILFVAHSDELGWTVDRITAEGRLKLKGSGGILPQAAEAHAVLVHTARGAVAGVVAPRPGYDERRPDNTTAPPYPA